MNTHAILTIALLTACCTPKRNEAEPSTSESHQALQDAFTTKMAALDEQIDGDGYPTRDDCDLALWVGESAFAGAQVNLDLLEYKPGEIHRRPPPACWTPTGGDAGSKSTVSQDMLLGYMLGRWRAQDLGAFQRLANYGEKHVVALPIPGWKMGEPFPDMATRVVMRTNGIGIATRAVYDLSGGKDDRKERKLPPAYVPVTEDYEQHIQAIAILLDGLVSEALRRHGYPLELADEKGQKIALTDVTDNELDTMHSLVAASPQNYFFQAILGRYTGDQEPAIQLLLSPDTPTPSYVRGHPSFALTHWLVAARVVLDSLQEQQ